MNGQNPEVQLAEFREYSTHRGWETAGEYVDAGVSGAKESRPALDRLMADVHRWRHAVLRRGQVSQFGRPLRYAVTALADRRVAGKPACLSPNGECCGHENGVEGAEAVRVRAGLRLARSFKAWIR